MNKTDCATCKNNPCTLPTAFDLILREQEKNEYIETYQIFENKKHPSLEEISSSEEIKKIQNLYYKETVHYTKQENKNYKLEDNHVILLHMFKPLNL